MVFYRSIGESNLTRQRELVSILFVVKMATMMAATREVANMCDD